MIKLIIGVVVMGLNVLPNHYILVALQGNSTEIFDIDSGNIVSKEELVNFINEYYFKVIFILNASFIFYKVQC